LFNRDRIERMGDHLAVLLNAIVKSPDTSVERLSILSARERNRILVEWNATQRTFAETSVHELFEAQAYTHPNAPAIITAAGRITYSELDGRSNRLAEDLIARGIATGDIVGISIERSPEMIVAILGVLKAGAAYLPLEATLPEERIAFMVRDSGAKLV